LVELLLLVRGRSAMASGVASMTVDDAATEMKVVVDNGGGGVAGGGVGESAVVARSRRAMVAEERIARDEWDLEAWQSLVADAQTRKFSSDDPPAPDYERFLKQFPTAARLWKIYAEHSRKELVKGVTGEEALHEGKARVRDIFDRGTRFCPTSVELWRSYTDFTRHYIGRPEAAALYEQALTSSGLDLSAHVIWTDYRDFLASAQDLDDAAKRQMVRKIYERMMRMPINNLDAIWREYEEFENLGGNRDLARGKLQENNGRYVASRAEARARKTRRENLSSNALAVPPGTSARDDEQARQWKKFLAAERSNPHTLDQKDLGDRVTHAFECALAVLYRYPDAWCEAARYQLDLGRVENAVSLLHRGIEALPASELLTFEIASLEESRKNKETARAFFEQLINTNPSALAYIQFMRFLRRCDSVEASRKMFTRARKDIRNVSYHVYVAAALMEFQLNREPKVARNIFELGLKTFPESIQFALEYIDFLWNNNEDSYLRVIFERVLSRLPAVPETTLVWNRFVQYEQTFGDATSFEATLRRCKDAMGDGYARSWTDVCLDRYRFRDLLPMALDETHGPAVTERRSGATSSLTNVGRSSKNSRSMCSPWNHAPLKMSPVLRWVRPFFPTAAPVFYPPSLPHMHEKTHTHTRSPLRETIFAYCHYR